ncbi:MAG: Multidrug resistance protein MdtA [Steroidobacteraceae bacterium]|nr:Multidrug resistance protein MdtA [Steroidobacteraceae bacterium]
MRTTTALLPFAALGALLGACGGSPAADSAKKDTPAEIPVEVATARRGEMLARYTGTATLEAEADAEVIARVGGEVAQVLVEEGDVVREGQVLAVLDGRQLRLEVAQSRAQFAKADRDYRRQVELHDKGLVSAGAFENLKFDLDNLRATLALAELQLSYTEIRAPFAGTVAARYVRVGQNVPQGTKTFRITDPTPLKASVFVPERELERLAPGQNAVAEIDALGSRTFPARVTLVSPAIDPATATFKVTLEMLGGEGVLKPGMFARVGIVFERKPAALQVPRVALVEADGAASVFIVEGGKAVQRAVTTGLADGGNIEVTRGVEDGDAVVIVGQNGLKSGNAVRVVSLESKPASALRAAAAGKVAADSRTANR